MANKNANKRHTIICACGTEQSTHSSIRTKCHKCQPKCRERHTFENLKHRKKQEKLPIEK
jgi:hypothetical protein